MDRKVRRPRWIAVRHAWLEGKADTASSVFILRDVSAAKQLERDSEHLRRERALVEMSALLAHEIRNPLGSLELFAGLLAESSLEGENRRWIEHVQAGLRTLSSTVNNVLDLHNEPPPERARIDAGELLDWAYDFLLPLAHQAKVEIQVVNGLAGTRFKPTGICSSRCCSILHSMPSASCRVVAGFRFAASTRAPLASKLKYRTLGQGFPRQTWRVSSRRGSAHGRAVPGSG